MSKLVEFQLEGGESILVEVAGDTRGMVPAADGSGIIGQAPKKFEECLSALKPMADAIVSELKSAIHPPEEVQVDLELQLSGKGKLIIAESEGSASIKVSLIWRNPNK